MSTALEQLALPAGYLTLGMNGRGTRALALARREPLSFPSGADRVAAYPPADWSTYHREERTPARRRLTHRSGVRVPPGQRRMRPRSVATATAAVRDSTPSLA